MTEFHTASVQKHGTTEAEAEAKISLKLQAEIESSYKNKEIETAEKAANAMLASLNKAEAAFQKANDDVPTGEWRFKIQNNTKRDGWYWRC